ncbi:hypothetical protein KIN20_016292 [Parelaphostrongylus tenuis]|uniref:Uncharacterized protein n=1 Tax=Parelaphostrongylus tenuis TaxID=148309 RepID=A0AAD5MYC3_PARTN|nr:hypothetical protein KIN20_016292 [Parelaphostrongylus tenuis]
MGGASKMVTIAMDNPCSRNDIVLRVRINYDGNHSMGGCFLVKPIQERRYSSLKGNRFIDNCHKAPPKLNECDLFFVGALRSVSARQQYVIDEMKGDTHVLEEAVRRSGKDTSSGIFTFRPVLARLFWLTSTTNGNGAKEVSLLNK